MLGTPEENQAWEAARLRRERAEWKEEAEVRQKRIAELEKVLDAIVFDATGCIDKPDKRLWPIRSVYHRRARALLEGREVDEKGWPTVTN